MRIKPDVKHINLGDFPRTAWPVSFGLRPALMKVFNYCRQYPSKMQSLKEIIEFMAARIKEWEEVASKCEYLPDGYGLPQVSGSMVPVEEQGVVSVQAVEVEQAPVMVTPAPAVPAAVQAQVAGANLLAALQGQQ